MLMNGVHRCTCRRMRFIIWINVTNSTSGILTSTVNVSFCFYLHINNDLSHNSAEPIRFFFFFASVFISIYGHVNVRAFRMYSHIYLLHMHYL